VKIVLRGLINKK